MKRELLYMFVSVVSSILLKILIGHPNVYMLVLPVGMALYLTATEILRRWKA